MGLKKTTTLKSGLQINHWAVKNHQIEREDTRVIIEVAPYLSKESKKKGFDSIGGPSEIVHVHIQDNINASPEFLQPNHYAKYFSPEVIKGRDIYEVIYDYLKKEVEFFRDATDDI